MCLCLHNWHKEMRQPHYGKGEAGQKAEREVAWFTEFLVGLTGTDEYNRLCNELGV